MSGKNRAGRRFAGAIIGALMAGSLAHTALASTVSPESGALLGAYVQPQTGWSDADVKGAIEGLEGDLGRPLAIDQHFYQWNQNFPTFVEPWDLANDRIPLVTWNSTSTASINSGSEDAWIDARADATRALEGTVLLRWFAEMEFGPNADLAGSPAAYVAAWRRIHDRFAARGAANVEWVWCPTAWGFRTGDAQLYYPGTDYVDWVCADGYNWAPVRPGSNWASFATIFSAFYDWGMTTGKPLIIAETGALERNEGEKAVWISQAQQTLKLKYPGVRALVYFDSRKTESSGVYDWRLHSSESSFAAFRALATDTYFDGTGDTTTPPPVTLSVKKEGAGLGRIVSISPLIDCGSVCTGTVVPGTSVTMEAVPAVGSTFLGWNGPCGGTGLCTIAMRSTEIAIAAFGKIKTDSQPDLALEKGSRLLGRHVHASSPVQQTVKGRLRQRSTRTVSIRLYNDGTATDTLLVRGTTQGRRFGARFLFGDTDVTEAVQAGTFSVDGLQPGAWQRLRVVLTAGKLPRGSIRAVTVIVGSQADPAAKDALRLRVRIV